MSLLNRAGQTVATKRADAQGGLLFRNVKPGAGYRVRPAEEGATSEPLTVLSTRSAPPSTDVYNQKIPSSGYGYLTTRDGTKLAYLRASAAGRGERPAGRRPAAARPRPARRPP